MLSSNFIKDILTIELDFSHEFDDFGMSYTDNPNALSFIDNEGFIAEVNANNNITGVITAKPFIGLIKNKLIIESNEPRYDFYNLMNIYNKKNHQIFTTIIGENSCIDKTAFVSPNNVYIGKNVVIEPKVVILPDVTIGDNCIIRSGAVIGNEGFEYKRTSKGIIAVFHNGKVVIGNNVIIGALNSIAKGFSFRNTMIKDNVVTDNLVHIAHGSIIGSATMIAAGAVISGSVDVGDNVWIGPNATISNRIKIENDAIITLGSVVTKHVKSGERVSGNFALTHDVFIKHLKSIAN